MPVEGFLSVLFSRGTLLGAFQANENKCHFAIAHPGNFSPSFFSESRAKFFDLIRVVYIHSLHRLRSEEEKARRHFLPILYSFSRASSGNKKAFFQTYFLLIAKDCQFRLSRVVPGEGSRAGVFFRTRNERRRKQHENGESKEGKKFIRSY